ncbi:MAG: DUF4262 domain-containing protein, partial [Nitriliruptorales bacterium]
FDLDELRFWIHGTIERHGWAIVAVGSPYDRDAPWAYTIGLSAGYDHPEFVITGALDCGAVFNELAAAVTAGKRFLPGLPDIEVLGIRARIGEVHPDEWSSGRLAAWVDYYGALGPPRPEPAAVQVIWPDEQGRFPGERGFDEGCPRMGECQPLLHSAGGMSSPFGSPPSGCSTRRHRRRPRKR